MRWGRPPVPGDVRKRRPFLVVSDDAFNANHRYEKVLVVHLSSSRRPGGPYEWDVEVPRGAAGLSHASTIKCNEVYTLYKTQLHEHIGRLPAAYMHRVDHALAVALGLPRAEPTAG